MKFKKSIAYLKSIQQLIRLPLTFINGGFTLSSTLRPWRERMSEGQVRGYQLGFTLIEILVVVLIIGILGAIALPQYQRALLKSRYAALMPIAKSMANSNEAYYLEHGIYADDPQDLLIQGQSRYTDDTELEFGTISDYAYVLAKNEDKIPNNTFIVYQKHSGEFPGEIHCEALADNDLAESVCKSFGGNESIGKTLTDGYETYVLFGTGNGVAPTGDNGGDEPEEPEEPQTPTCEGVSCDDQGNITECPSGKTLNNGACVACDIANATACSTTAYVATECETGYIAKNGVCEKAGKTYSSSCATWYGGEQNGHLCSGNNTFIGSTKCESTVGYEGCNYNTFQDTSTCLSILGTCQYNIFEGASTCLGRGGTGCMYNTFKPGSTCEAQATPSGVGCHHSTFEGATCLAPYGSGGNACAVNTFTNGAKCIVRDNGGDSSLACTGSTFTNNSRCIVSPDYGINHSACGTYNGIPSTYDETSCCVANSRASCPTGTSCAEKGLPDNP